MDVEAIRARYRPERITTLFVGESAPASGKFFYHGNTAMAHNRGLVLRHSGLLDVVLHTESDFFEWLERQGWYLDNLVLRPVDKMSAPNVERCARPPSPALPTALPHIARRRW